MRYAGGGVLLLALLCAPTPAQAEGPPGGVPTRFGGYGGVMHTAGAGGRASYGRFTYPTMGVVVDHEWFWGGVETPAPMLIVDAIFAAGAYLAGADGGLPLFDLLHGDGEPGRVRLFEVAAAARPLRHGPHALELGLRGSMNLLGPEVEGERLGGSVFDLGLTAGYACSSDDLALRVYGTAGNGFGHERDGNPFVGVSTFLIAPFSNVVGLLVRTDAQAQWLDHTVPGDTFREPNDVVEWGVFHTTTIGLVFGSE